MNHFHLSRTNVLCIRRNKSVWSDICHLLSSSFVCSALIASVSTEHVPGAAVVTIITTSNLSPSTICDPKLLAAPSGICNIDTIARNGIKATHYCNMLRLLSVSLKQNYLIGTLSRQCPRPESQLLVSDCLQFRADQSCENAAAAAEMFQQCS